MARTDAIAHGAQRWVGSAMRLPGAPDASSLMRRQFRVLQSVSSQLLLDEDRQRRMLLLNRQEWPAWSAFLRDGALPSRPAVPIMLRRLGAASYRLAALAERHGGEHHPV